MKLTARVDGHEYPLEIKRDGRQVTATIDGRKADLDVSEVEPGIFLLKKDGKVYEVAVSVTADGKYLTNVRGVEIEVELIDPKRLRGGASAGDDTGGRTEIKSAMPGKIVRVIASAGDHVSKGDGVLVVEAMKMQNELRSPRVGIVKEITVAEGDTVGAGQLLAVIE